MFSFSRISNGPGLWSVSRSSGAEDITRSTRRGLDDGSEWFERRVAGGFGATRGARGWAGAGVDAAAAAKLVGRGTGAGGAGFDLMDATKDLIAFTSSRSSMSSRGGVAGSATGGSRRM